ncbi:protein of unknown function [Pseudorhizobium banfieldiae]|uniref:Uncharacterized protein n=1 Tax=Pseudorhizobium banfieldiae TaxID=1125847 RepID=L0NIV6_9HYPH|nr:protein of unknown function [Pseudorhizobium banfieldiae]
MGEAADAAGRLLWEAVAHGYLPKLAIYADQGRNAVFDPSHFGIIKGFYLAILYSVLAFKNAQGLRQSDFSCGIE